MFILLVAIQLINWTVDLEILNINEKHIKYFNMCVFVMDILDFTSFLNFFAP